MKKYSLFLLLIVLLISVKVSVAQEEVYEQPAQIIDTLETEEKVSKDTRSKEQKEDALTELEKKKEKLNRLRLGGNFGLQFGNYTYVMCRLLLVIWW
jgi:hypothetical protein